MGYYTDFTLEIEHDGKPVKGKKVDEILLRLTDISQYNFEDLEVWYNHKWYDWKIHMRALSKEYPELLFTLDGKGEEHGDLWKAYFKNGKVQTAEAIIGFAPFDESKLK